jgi:SLT domain-containing protein
MAQSMYGWTGAEWDALYRIMMQESGFRNTAQNPTSTAYGMFQFLDSTWAGYGIPKTSDPTQQTIAGLRYIKGRYGNPMAAEAHEMAYNWYDNGGWLKNGGIGINQSGKPEPVFTDAQWRIMKNLVSRSVPGLNGAGLSNVASEFASTYNVTIDMKGAHINSNVDMEEAVYSALIKIDDKLGRTRTIG